MPRGVTKGAKIIDIMTKEIVMFKPTETCEKVSARLGTMSFVSLVLNITAPSPMQKGAVSVSFLVPCLGSRLHYAAAG